MPKPEDDQEIEENESERLFSQKLVSQYHHSLGECVSVGYWQDEIISSDYQSSWLEPSISVSDSLRHLVMDFDEALQLLAWLEQEKPALEFLRDAWKDGRLR